MEVFEEDEPKIVAVEVNGGEDSRKYWIAGRTVEEIGDAIKAALQGLGHVSQVAGTKKARKPRRTKDEMATAAEPTGDTPWPK